MLNLCSIPKMIIKQALFIENSEGGVQNNLFKNSSLFFTCRVSKMVCQLDF